ncbi:MAG TPA: nucleotide exchange factor GrpE [Bacteroidales bacterium]|jgi:molecular chaperone GrpE|nr:nucleotide exchange factor GrpE [Bacteroidales bacterium]OQC58058.1 MAG: heat shock protein GrpE [Bacteroidetes bacterium ADurb.Bin013]NLZ08596.1 nucleotide exchange factor GrpE [Bacteroidales bacterium]HOF76495.1 nucleotide exchange factor GrpE [Bacteroidales bacterium]HOQ96525.1 nucleotide exchange factor GrpE [Bacteroidales bacterium]
MQADKKKHQAQEGPDVPHVEERDNVSGANGQAPAQEEPGTGIAQAEETPDVNKLKEQLDQTNDRLLRLHAEFDNYRKRTAKERLDLVLTASEDVIKGMLPVLDDCQRALRTLEKLENADPVSVEGVNLIYSKLLTYLQGRGLKIIEAKGKPLDTDFHCAVAKTPVKEKKLKGKIVDVVMEGYTLNGKVIRFANVVVGE